jgi:hypothetical protein
MKLPVQAAAVPRESSHWPERPLPAGVVAQGGTGPQCPPGSTTHCQAGELCCNSITTGYYCAVSCSR